MDARFVFQSREDAAAADLRRRFLEAADAGLVDPERFEPPPLDLRVALIHPEQVGGEQGRLLAAGAGAHLEDRVLLVGRILRKHQHLQLAVRSEEHTSELQSLMRISSAVFCSKQTKQ